MYLDDYFESVEQLFRRIRETQREAIIQAAKAIAESLARGGALLVMDTGHLLKFESQNRAGGLMALTPFSYRMEVESPIATRPDTHSEENAAMLERRKAELALDMSTMYAGDVLIINSNSGRTPNVIEVALQCRERGIITVAICSSEQMRNCPPAHISGKKLFDIADICIDNCGPHGDALVAVRDNEKMCPGSGMAAAYILWAIQAEAVEQLQARGINPSIYRSVHVSGFEYLEKQRQEFLKKGL